MKKEGTSRGGAKGYEAPWTLLLTTSCHMSHNYLFSKRDCALGFALPCTTVVYWVLGEGADNLLF